MPAVVWTLLDFALAVETAEIHENGLDATAAEICRGILSDATEKKWTVLFSQQIDRTLVAVLGSFDETARCEATVHGFWEQRLLSVSLQEVFTSDSEKTATEPIIRRISQLVSKRFGCDTARGAVQLPRSVVPNNLHLASDNKQLLIYDFDRVVVDVRSAFQHIQIFHSPTYGNTLLLDGDVSAWVFYLAESDLVYTHTLMQKGINEFKNKQVLILGGGDGALLHELLKESPTFVTMVDIDETVMQLCRVHMRSCCGDALDSFLGPNYKNIVSDCFPVMKSLIAARRKFDYVFSDLTAVPIDVHKDQNGGFWQLIEKVLEESMQLLTGTGQLLMQFGKAYSRTALADFEKLLKRKTIQFKQHVALVPSFIEPWIFYSLNCQQG